MHNKATCHIHTVFKHNVCLNRLFFKRFGTEELKQQFLVPIIKGEQVSSIGVSESSGGSDVASAYLRHLKVTVNVVYSLLLNIYIVVHWTYLDLPRLNHIRHFELTVLASTRFYHC